MSSTIKVHNYFALVIGTTGCTDNVELRLARLRAPFEYTRQRNQGSFPLQNNEYKAYVEALHLGINRIPDEVVSGHQIPDFREKLWLHRTSMPLWLQVLQDDY
ncbi:hypothetical protein PHMEG_00031683 [Phytophthora megakarya]|uniref:Uncharacterized protein n=1 Tax=Phytophthora megakarya TaxID=4795 RepID=A0A225UX46_9STRA|nr:hypothetical protein PHMEG_00031683 [Phytophthora megakarya]